METTFKNYWRVLSSAQKAELAAKAETSKAVLSQIAHGHKKPGRKMIEKLTSIDSNLSVQMFF